MWTQTSPGSSRSSRQPGGSGPSGPPTATFWEGSTWEWELAAPARARTGTGVLFRHYGFADGYPEIDLAHTAHTGALILQRLGGYLASGRPQPFFPASAA